VGGEARVIDVRVARGTGGVEGAAWGTAKVVGASRGWSKSSKQAPKEQPRSYRLDRPACQSYC
jgi:hypothetical protein